MGQVIQGPWKPLAERAPSQPVYGTSQCTIIRLRPYRIRPEMKGTEAELHVIEASKAASPNS